MIFFIFINIKQVLNDKRKNNKRKKKVSINSEIMSSLQKSIQTSRNETNQNSIFFLTFKVELISYLMVLKNKKNEYK